MTSVFKYFTIKVQHYGNNNIFYVKKKYAILKRFLARCIDK